MKWWEIPQNCECLFSLDADSVLSEGSSRIALPSTEDNWLTTQGSIQNRVRPVDVFGYSTDVTMRNNLSSLKFYKGLKIDDINLVFNTPISTGPKCTWFLKCVVKDSSVLSQGSTTATYGLTMDPFGSSQEYSKSWYANKVLSSKNGVPISERNINISTLYNVTISNSSIEREVKFKTDYSENTVPENSDYFTSQFGSDHEVFKIGYDSSSWQPKVEIVAYGLFTKILSEEEILLMQKAIDDEFLMEKNDISFKTNLKYYSDFKVISNNNNYKTYVVGDWLAVQEPVKNLLINKTNLDKMKPIQAMYENYENIVDVVLEEGVPVQVKLYLYERTTGELLKTTTSNSEGIFTFNNLGKDLEYIVTANDSKYQFQSVIKNYNN